MSPICKCGRAMREVMVRQTLKRTLFGRKVVAEWRTYECSRQGNSEKDHPQIVVKTK